MANITFDQLPASAGLSGDEIVPIDTPVGGGSYVTGRTTTANIANLGSPAGPAPVVLAQASPLFPNARVLSGTVSDIVLADGGPQNNLTIDLAATAVAPGAYGSSTSVAVITVDQKGRLTSASSVAIDAASAGALLKANNLSDLANASTARTNLGVAIGVNVQAFSTNLTSWAAITRAAGFDAFTATPSSANVRALVTDGSGTGALLYQNGNLGTPSAAVLANATGLPIGTGVSGLATNMAAFLAGGTSAQLAAAVADETGSGKLVFNTGPILSAPAFSGATSGTTTLQATATASGTLTLPAATDTLVGRATTDTLTNKTISGASNTITNVPISTGISGLGTGVATALGANVGTSGAVVVNGGALGTPASGTATNLTGLPLTSGVTGLLPVANGGTNIASYTIGDMLYASGTTTLAKLSASTAGYLLQANGAGVAPTYAGFAQPVGTSPSTRTWQSKASDFVSIVDYGAIGDGNIANASINATALTNALATGKMVWIPWTSAGYHFGTNQITVATSQCIVGENQVLLKSTATTSLFYITSYEVSVAPAVIQNLKIDMTGSGASSTAIRFATSLSVVAGAQISQMLFTNCVEAIGDETTVSSYVVDIKLYDIRCLITRGRQVYIRRSRGFIWIDTLRIDQTAGSGQTVIPVTWNSAQFDDFIGLEINRFDSVGPITTTFQSAVWGLYIDGTTSAGKASVWLNRILIDNTSGNGIYVFNTNYVNANWLEAFQNLGNQILIDTVTESNFSNILAHGGVGVTGAAAGANGVTIQNSTEVAVSNITCNSNTGAGLSVAGTSSGVIVTNLQSASNSGAGLVLAGSADYTRVISGYMASNAVTVSNSATGTHNVIKDIGGYNPVGATAAATAGASPFTYTAGTSPETLYFKQTATNTATITQGGQQIAALANASTYYPVELGPNESVVVTWTTTAPTYTKFVH